ncbi:MAG: signal peptide peptidase SppA [bacterium]|nr:signal peptide peptidase SppA [bacterium]
MRKRWWLIGGFGCFILFIAGIVALVFLLILISGEQPLVLSGKKVVVIEVMGPIYQSQPYIDLLHRYKDSPRVRAVILRINSPGGTVGAAQEIYQEVKKLRKEGKIVVASMADLGASGAYYIACAANEIIANPGTLTGSIGVVMEMFNIEELGNKIGLQFTTIKSGKFKDSGSVFRKMTKEEQVYLQQLIDNVQQQFYQVVVDNRKEAVRKVMLSQKKERVGISDTEKLQVSTSDIEEYIKQLADGRIYTGQQAKEAGLIDGLGNLETAIDRAAELAHIPGKPDVVTVRPREKTLFETLFSEMATILTPLKRNGISLQYILK